MTDPMPTIMQAAERLRLLESDNPLAGYVSMPREFGQNILGLVDLDRRKLADFALSILDGVTAAYQQHGEHAKRCNFEACGCEFCQPLNAVFNPAAHKMPTTFAVR